MKHSYTSCLAAGFVCLFLFGASRGDSIDAVATFNNVGLDLQLSTAPPAGTAVDVAIKPTGSPGPYVPVHPLSRVGTDRYSGSVFQLAPGTAYSVRLSSSAFGSDQFVDVTTRPDSFPSATGSVYHVAPGGDDSKTGLSLGDAFRTVAQALSVAQAGDEVQLHEGKYYEGDLAAPRSGTSTAPIVIRSAPGEHAALDGTDPNFAPAWTLSDPVNKVYRTTTASQPQNAYVDGGHLFRYSGLADLAGNVWNTPGGYYADGTNLYVRFPNGDAPTGHTVTVPRYTTGLTLENKNYIQLRDLEIAYFGYGDFHRGVYIDGGDYNLIDNCNFHQNGIGVALKRAADFNTIQNSRFSESPVSQWMFEAVKQAAGDYEAGAIYVYGSTTPNRGNVIRRNVIQDMFDGAHLYSFSASGPTTHLDFYGNRISKLGDDGVETDGAGSNVRIYGNAISQFLTGISLAPASGGPTYVMRNVLWDWRQSVSGDFEGYPFKFNVGSDLSTNWVYLYHNTAYTDEPGQDGFLLKGYSDWSDVISRNNIYAGTRYALESWPDVIYNDRVDMDYDNLYTTDGSRFILWSWVSYADLAAFFAATGQEENGVRLLPGFVDAFGADFHLAPGSAMIDLGLIIPGVNDGWFGAGPDLGAFEFEGVVPEAGSGSAWLLAAAALLRRGLKRTPGPAPG